MIDTETTLCEQCQVPVEAPKIVPLNPFMAFRPVPLCKDCLLKAKIAHFETIKYRDCPYKIPHWRPQP